MKCCRILSGIKLITIFFVVLIISGCESLKSSSRDTYRYVRPRVAVFKFENKAGSPMRWDLGTGMTDVMVSGLVDTGRFTVIEREDLAAILREIDLQHKTGITRPEGRVSEGRLTNVGYLIKGTVTDFSHVSRSSIRIGTKSSRFNSGSALAIVSMVITVIEVESGEVILSTTVSSSVRARGIDIATEYSGVSFGGQAFYRTPLGKATRKAMDDAINRIIISIGRRPWSPAIVSVDDQRIIINGGADRRISKGFLYSVMEEGEMIYDPETGNYLGRAPGTRIGIIEITEVFERFAYARLVEGLPGESGAMLKKTDFRDLTPDVDSSFRENQ